MRAPDMGTALAMGLLAGILCGMMPLIMGFLKHRPGAGISGFFACAVSGLFCGALLAGPVGIGLAAFIWYRGDSRANELGGNAGLSEADYRRERQRVLSSRRRVVDTPDPRLVEQPYTAIGHVLVCNSCRQSTSKGPGGVIPPECPTCGLRFVSLKESRAARAPKVARVVEDDLVDLQVADRPRR